MNEDSILSIFSTSLSKLGLNGVERIKGVNNCDDAFRDSWSYAMSSAAERKIINAHKGTPALELIPVISFRNSNESGMYFTSSGGVGGSRYQKKNSVFITVFLMQMGKLMYKQSAVFHSEFYSSYDKMEVQHLLTQKDWDELVALVMKDYVERIRE
jgi:hypothetical protein